MNFSSKLIEQAVNAFATLPGIGKKTALRLTLHLMNQPIETTEEFAYALVNMRKNIKHCNICHNVSDASVCTVCADTRRDRSVICVVENIRDVMAIEDTQQFKGLYHVLGGVISPIEGISPKDLNIDTLVERVNSGKISEVVLALNASMEGDTTNFFLFRKLADSDIKITTLSRGVAVGTELHYTDELTLGRSIINRMPFDMSLVRK